MMNEIQMPQNSDAIVFRVVTVVALLGCLAPNIKMVLAVSDVESSMSAADRELWKVDACCTRSSCPLESAAPSWHHTATLNLRVTLKWNADAVAMSDLELAAKMNKENLSQERTALKREEANSHAKANLAVLRKLFAPAPGTKSVVTNALLGRELLQNDSCTLSWDTMECRGLSVTDLLKILPESVPVCRLLPSLPSAPLAPPVHVSTALSSEKLIAALGLSKHVSLITGLTPFDYRSVAVRHKARQLGTFSEFHPRAWPVAEGSSSPVIVNLVPVGPRDQGGAFGINVSLAVYCTDGSNATGSLPSLCASADDYQPSMFNVSFTSSLSGVTSYSTFQATACSNDDSLPFEDSYFLVQICSGTVYLVPTPLDRLRIAAQTVFINSMNSSAPSAFSDWQKLMTYYNSQYGTEATVIFPSPTTLQVISDLYEVPFPFTSSSSGSGSSNITAPITVGILEFQNIADTSGYGGALLSDVSKFVATYNRGVSWNNSNLIMLNTQQVTQLETTLDASLVCGLLPGLPVTVENLVYGRGTPYPTFSAVLVAWAQRLAAGTAGPDELHTVFSISWGGYEKYIDAMGAITDYFRLLSVAGVTIVASTGDGGAVPYVPYYDGPAVEFPASSPYVVAVGATALLQSTTTTKVEITCSAADANVITSGGGFALRSPPIPPQASFLPSGYSGFRGTPDVAAIGANLPIFVNGTPSTVFGTSASAPIIASLITMLNLDRAAIGLAPLNLIHYFFYNQSLADTFFNDIVSGNNCAGETSESAFFVVPYASPPDCYSATPGWDAVTGLGTPRYVDLRHAALQYSAPPQLTISSGGGNNLEVYFYAGGGVGGLLMIVLCFFCRHQQKKRTLRMEFSQIALNEQH
jgi:hypothetical protein